MSRVDTAIPVLDTLLHEILLTSLRCAPALEADFLEECLSAFTSLLFIIPEHAPGVIDLNVAPKPFLEWLPVGRLDVEEHPEHVKGALGAQVFKCILEHRGALLHFVGLSDSALGCRKISHL